MNYRCVILTALVMCNCAIAEVVDTSWVRYFPAGPGNTAQLTAMELDSLDNPVVAGWMSTASSGSDFWLCKILSDGDTAWLRSYDFPEHGTDRASCISIWLDQKVAVSGACNSDVFGSKYCGSLIYSAEGELIDTLLYPLEMISGSSFQAWSIATGPVISVVGSNEPYSYNLSVISRIGHIVDSRISLGNFDPVCAIVNPDRLGISLAGRSTHVLSRRYAVASVDLNPFDLDTNWVRYETMSDVATDMDPTAIAPYGDGGTVVTGMYRSMTWTSEPYRKDWVTYAFDSSGEKLWVAEEYSCRGKPSTIAVDLSGNTYVGGVTKAPSKCSGSDTDTNEVMVVLYDDAGVRQWEFLHTVPGFAFHDVVASAVDNAGNLYVAMNVLADVSGQDFDMNVIKIDLGGHLVWSHTVGSPDEGKDSLAVMQLDESNNIYLGGTTNGNTIAVAKLVQNTVVAVNETGTPPVPSDFWLAQNYPNPFNPVTEFSYSIPRAGHVMIEIINIAGQCVRRLVDDEVSSGPHHATWDARDTEGRTVASGVYFYQLKAAGLALSKKMLYLR